MIINYLEKLFVTNVVAAILRELEVYSAATKMFVLSSHMQKKDLINNRLYPRFMGK